MTARAAAGLEEIARKYTVDSAAWAFAAHWAAQWLRRAARLRPAPVRQVSVVIGDATRDELDPDAPYLRALELFCMREGMHVLTLSARGIAGIGDAVAVHRPNLVVVAGRHLGDDTVARWAYGIAPRLGAAAADSIPARRRAGSAAGRRQHRPAVRGRRGIQNGARARGGRGDRKGGWILVARARARRDLVAASPRPEAPLRALRRGLLRVAYLPGPPVR